MESGVRRIVIAFAILLGVVGLASIGFTVLGHGTWSFEEAVYFALITVSTVGYAEMHDVGAVKGARVLTGLLIIFGSGALVYFQSNITATLVEGRLGHALRRKRMFNKIKALRDHVIIAGVGSTGKHVVEELFAIQKQFVAIDSDLEKLERISQEVCGGNMLYVHADATHDQTLIDCNIEHAGGVIAALPTDRENLYVTLSARNLNDRARIVAKVIEAEAARKMIIAGADATVSPNIIGGQRLASELVRPEVMQFLDQMVRDKDRNLRLEELPVPADSSFAGLSLRQAPFRSAANVLVIAVRDAQGTFIYNPGPDFVLTAGVVLIVLGETPDIRQLRELVRKSSQLAMSEPPPRDTRLP